MDRSETLHRLTLLSADLGREAAAQCDGDVWDPSDFLPADGAHLDTEARRLGVRLTQQELWLLFGAYQSAPEQYASVAEGEALAAEGGQ